MLITHTSTNVTAMQMLKRGEFDGQLVEFSTDKDGITTVAVHTKEEGEK